MSVSVDMCHTEECPCGGQERATDSPVAGVTGNCELPTGIQMGSSARAEVPLTTESRLQPELFTCNYTNFQCLHKQNFQKISGNGDTICSPATGQEDTASAACRHMGNFLTSLNSIFFHFTNVFY